MIKRIVTALWHRRNYVYALPLVREAIRMKLHPARRSGSLAKCASVCFDYKKYIDDEQTNLIEEVQAYLSDYYELFGSTKQLTENKWNQDFRTGHVWPSGQPYFRYKIIDYATHSDVKYPWDMSRCHHLLILGRAYQITGDERYSEKIKADILDFIDKNPFLRSINWTCAMDVGIRAANWIHALALISTSRISKDERFLKTVLNSLEEHRFFIEKNIEKGINYSGNHYMADLAGLIHIYLFLGISNKKRDYYIREFENEVRSQVLPSGFHFEKSTSYHKLVTEMVLYTYLTLRETKIDVSDDVVAIIKKMVHFLAAIMQPDGNIPFIGDNDNGRFLPFVTTGYADARQLLEVGKKAFPEEHFETPNVTQYFDDAKLAVMRSGSMYATIHNNPLSFHQSGDTNKLCNSHTHCDMLSFTLSDGMQNIIVDLGTFCYTSSPELRFKYRSTAMHNTVCVGGRDQQMQNRRNLFTLTQSSFPTKTEMQGKNCFMGEYEYRDNGVVRYCHQRVFALREDCCTVDDKLIIEGEQLVKSYLHFAPSITLKVVNDYAEITSAGKQYKIQIKTLNEITLKVVEGEVSESYGKSEPAQVLAIDFGKTKGELLVQMNIQKTIIEEI